MISYVVKVTSACTYNSHLYTDYLLCKQIYYMYFPNKQVRTTIILSIYIFTSIPYLCFIPTTPTGTVSRKNWYTSPNKMSLPFIFIIDLTQDPFGYLSGVFELYNSFLIRPSWYTLSVIRIRKLYSSIGLFQGRKDM